MRQKIRIADIAPGDGPCPVQILADENTPFNYALGGEIYIVAHHEALAMIPLDDAEIAMAFRLPDEELAELRENPNRLTLLQRLQVAMLLNATADRTEDPDFARFLAQFLDQHTRGKVGEKFDDAVALAIVTGSPAMTQHAMIDTFVAIGGVELLEHVPPTQGDVDGSDSTPNEREP